MRLYIYGYFNSVVHKLDYTVQRAVSIMDPFIHQLSDVCRVFIVW